VYPNSDNTFNSTLTVTTTSLTPSNTYVVTVVAGATLDLSALVDPTLTMTTGRRGRRERHHGHRFNP
jgi:hypothetical protein